MRKNSRVILAVFAALALSAAAQARVTSVVVEGRKSPAHDGRTLGAAGQYEVLSGYVFGELAPAIR